MVWDAVRDVSMAAARVEVWYVACCVFREEVSDFVRDVP